MLINALEVAMYSSSVQCGRLLWCFQEDNRDYLHPVTVIRLTHPSNHLQFILILTPPHHSDHTFPHFEKDSIWHFYRWWRCWGLPPVGEGKVTNIPIMEMRGNCGKYKHRCKYTHSEMQKQIWRYTDSQNTSGQKHIFLFIKKLSLQQHLISNLNRFKFDKFQYRFGMSRQLWKADFQIQVWQKIQTLNPANPGMALLLQPARSLGKLFFQSNSLALLSGVGFYVEKCHISVSVSGEAINFGISIPESQKGKHCALGIWLWSFLFFVLFF